MRPTHVNDPRGGPGARRLGVWIFAVLVALVGSAVLTACGSMAEETENGGGYGGNADSDPTDEQNTEAAESVGITITDYEFDVPDTVAPGTEVTVSNEDSVTHTVTSDEEGMFDVSIDGGSEATFTVPEEPGEYAFHCTPHPDMTSTLVIE